MSVKFMREVGLGFQPAAAFEASLRQVHRDVKTPRKSTAAAQKGWPPIKMLCRFASCLRTLFSLLGLLSCVSAAPQSADKNEAQPVKSTLDGVYTEAQATRGKAAYDTSCSSCHAADLSGFSGPPLTGDRFMDRWREFNLNILSDLIKNTMPLNNAGTLSEAGYLEVVAYILRTNGLPAGSDALTAGAVTSTLLVGKDGPKPLPTSAQVEVVGCLTLDSSDGWLVTQASEPVRTLDPFEPSTEETTRAKSKPFGDQLFRLQNITEIPGFTADALQDNKVQIKGILVRQPRNERINVTYIQKVGPPCEQ
jgi:mono/diheme cytochrome c family protein